MDLIASGTQPFLKAGDNFIVRADGTVQVTGLISGSSVDASQQMTTPSLIVTQGDFEELRVSTTPGYANKSDRIQITNDNFFVYASGTIDIPNALIGSYTLIASGGQDPETHRDIVWDDLTDTVTLSGSALQTGDSPAQNNLTESAALPSSDNQYRVRFSLRLDTTGVTLGGGSSLITINGTLQHRLNAGAGFTGSGVSRGFGHDNELIPLDETNTYDETVTVLNVTNYLEFRILVKQDRSDFGDVSGNSIATVTGNNTAGEGIEWTFTPAGSSAQLNRRALRLFSPNNEPHFLLDPTPTVLPSDASGSKGEFIFIGGSLNSLHYHDGNVWNKISGTVGGPGTHQLGQHTDTDIGTAISGSIIQFTGASWITGSLPSSINTGSFTGSFTGSVSGTLIGTASFAETASLLLGSVESASFAETASFLLGSVESASFAETARSASFAQTASFLLGFIDSACTRSNGWNDYAAS